ncbi:MAG: OmpA family protein [Nitrospiraceae bacterium]|nr:OmpA family protein [Nitrospiraceae bacterium]
MKSAFLQDQPDGSSASGIADLMTSLAVIFILLLAAHLTRVEEGNPKPIPQSTADLAHRLKPLHLAVEPQTDDPRLMTVVVPDGMLNFETGKSTLLPSAEVFLEETMPHYAAMMCGPHGHEVESFVIEGHTDDHGEDILNLKLSQDRSFAVFVKGLDVIRARLPWAYECFLKKSSATGRGKQDLLHTTAGYPNRDKSRRVIFKIHLQPQ